MMRRKVMARLVALLACLCLLPVLAAGAADDAERHEVVVVGAGLAGLSAAYFLVGRDVLVLEKEPVAGGSARNDTWEGVEYGRGYQHLGLPLGALRVVLDDLDLDLREVPPPMDAAMLGRRLYVGDDELALMLIEHGGQEAYQRFVAILVSAYESYDHPPLFDFSTPLAVLDRQTARRWLGGMDLPAIYLARYNGLARGFFGANLDEINALCLLPEAADVLEESLTPSDLPPGAACPPVRDQAHTGVFTPRGGVAALAGALAKRLGENLRTSCTVTGVRRQDGGFMVTYRDADGEERKLAAASVIMALPAPTALKLTGPALDPERAKLLEQIPYAPYLTVSLLCNEPIFDEAFDLAAPEGMFFTDLCDPLWVARHYGDDLPQDVYLLRANCPAVGYKDRGILGLSDQEAVRRVLADLERMFPGASKKVTATRVDRFPLAKPVMTPGAYRRLESLNRLNQQASAGLVLAGDYLVYPSVDGAVESGRLAAEALGAPTSNPGR